ncbi:hypothetical protein TWF106_006753 [Orbilia oligospora]|uniref:DUF7514 domain-containing protein n=1 Tax=Orbilia oligospora TaxID=2813651 RepID=A0A7C8UR26_ORBOL|nr:hypothetical protein TWF106_006753 [Orbilia oligospora]
MSLRHTIKTLLSGPQTQASPPGGFGYPTPNQPHHAQQQPGYHQAAPVNYGNSGGQPAMVPNPQSYGYAPPPSQFPQMYAPPPQQQSQQYHCPPVPLNSVPSGPLYHQNHNSFTPQSGLSYAPPSAPPPPLQQSFQPPNSQIQQYGPTPSTTSIFQQPSQSHTLAQGQYLPPTQYGLPPPVPSATHPNYQQPVANSLHQEQQKQQPTSNLAQQYANVPHLRQDQQQPPRTPLSPPPPYMQFEQPFISQAAVQPSGPAATSPRPTLNFAPPSLSNNPKPPSSQIEEQQSQEQSQSQQYANSYTPSVPKLKSSTSGTDIRDVFGSIPQQTSHLKQTHVQADALDEPQRPASTKPQSDPVASKGATSTSYTPTGIIHPSMFTQWNTATSVTSGRIPHLPAGQPQSPTKSMSAQPPPTADTINSAPPQPTYPGIKGHKPTQSVNRSLTFSKKNADGSPNWNGTLLTIDGMSSETFTRFVNGLYNFAGQDEDPLGLTPDQMRILLERLDMPDERNYPKRYSLAAPKAKPADPASFVHTSLIQYYSIFDVTYITEGNLMPIVTRDGFQQYMTAEVLIDPSGMHRRFLRLLANFGNQIIDPFTKVPFGNVQFQREYLPPVPNDQYIARDKKQQEALQAREAHDSQQYYNSDQQTSGYHQSGSWGI